MIKGMTKQDYMKEYMRQRRAKYLCIYCNHYCTQYDKHYKTIEHLKNIAQHLNLKLEHLITK